MDQQTTVTLERVEDYKLFFANAPDAVILVDQFNNIKFWNPKAEAIFGWTSTEVIGKSLSDTIVPPAFREAHDSGMKRHLSTGEVRVLNKTIEVPALHRSGAEFFIALTISRIELHGISTFLAFIRDITEQKKNQSELEQKTKELERSNATLQEFAYAASHDLKEPVRKIHIFTDRLKSSLAQKLDEPEWQLLSRIENATTRMSTLIDDLLMYSHISLGTDAIENVPLNEIVDLVLEDLEVEIQEKNAQLTIALLPEIKGHKRQLQQLFQNLISNSLKYSKPAEAPHIHIKAAVVNGEQLSEAGDKTFHLVQVSDNGIGFEQHDAGRIFHMFQRLHGNNAYKGSGVGLSIVQKVVENHHAFIKAESEPGKGATFKIYFPVL